MQRLDGRTGRAGIVAPRASPRRVTGATGNVLALTHAEQSTIATGADVP
jgi:hypothetical protein